MLSTPTVVCYKGNRLDSDLVVALEALQHVEHANSTGVPKNIEPCARRKPGGEPSKHAVVAKVHAVLVRPEKVICNRSNHRGDDLVVLLPVFHNNKELGHKLGQKQVGLLGGAVKPQHVHLPVVHVAGVLGVVVIGDAIAEADVVNEDIEAAPEEEGVGAVEIPGADVLHDHKGRVDVVCKLGLPLLLVVEDRRWHRRRRGLGVQGVHDVLLVSDRRPGRRRELLCRDGPVGEVVGEVQRSFQHGARCRRKRRRDRGAVERDRGTAERDRVPDLGRGVAGGGRGGDGVVGGRHNDSRCSF